MKKKIKREKFRIKKNKLVCASCGIEFEESNYSLLCNVIMEHKPVCSYECNKTLGQTK